MCRSTFSLSTLIIDLMDVNILQQVVSILLEKGAKVDHEDKEGMTPLLVAAFEGHRWVYTLGSIFGLVKFETLVCKIFSCFASLTHSDSHNQMKLAIRMFVLCLFNLHQDYYLKSIILSTWTIFPRPDYWNNTNWSKLFCFHEKLISRKVYGLPGAPESKKLFGFLFGPHNFIVDQVFWSVQNESIVFAGNICFEVP